MKAANDNQKDKSIARACLFWQPRLGRDFSCEDARQSIENVSGFFGALADWAHDERTVPANDNEGADGLIAIATGDLARSADRGTSEHG